MSLKKNWEREAAMVGVRIEVPPSHSHDAAPSSLLGMLPPNEVWCGGVVVRWCGAEPGAQAHSWGKIPAPSTKRPFLFIADEATPTRTRTLT